MPRGIPNTGKKTMGKRGPQKKYVGQKKEPVKRTSAKNIVMTKFEDLQESVAALTSQVGTLMENQVILSKSLQTALQVQKASMLDAWKNVYNDVTAGGDDLTPEMFIARHSRSCEILGITPAILASEVGLIPPEIKTPEVEVHVEKIEETEDKEGPASVPTALFA